MRKVISKAFQGNQALLRSKPIYLAASVDAISWVSNFYNPHAVVVYTPQSIHHLSTSYTPLKQSKERTRALSIECFIQC